MTDQFAGDDLADVAGVPHLALDDDDLDVLELVLTGALPELPSLEGWPDGSHVVLTDVEGTPLASVGRQAVAGSVPSALRSLARAGGMLWDPVIRRPASEVRAGLANGPHEDDVLALIVDDVPTVADVAAMGRAAGGPGIRAVLVVVLAARRARRVGQVSWGGLARAAVAASATIAAQHPATPVLPLIVPWPDRGAEVPPVGVVRFVGVVPDLAAVLAAYGARQAMRVTGLRSPDDAERVASLTGAQERLVRDLYPPESAPDVLRALEADRSAHRRGAVVLFTGLSGSGKSTIARALTEDLADRWSREVTLLDGDEVRRHLSAGLGFDERSRAINVERIGYVAALVAEHGGIAIAAPIAPFASSRSRVREMARQHGAFVLVHVATPLDVCEARDRKGMYARARAGEIPDFTGISSPYEAPDDADVVIDTTSTSVDDAVSLVRDTLEDRLAAARVPPA